MENEICIPSNVIDFCSLISLIVWLICYVVNQTNEIVKNFFVNINLVRRMFRNLLVKTWLIPTGNCVLWFNYSKDNAVQGRFCFEFWLFWCYQSQIWKELLDAFSNVASNYIKSSYLVLSNLKSNFLSFLQGGEVLCGGNVSTCLLGPLKSK